MIKAIDAQTLKHKLDNGENIVLIDCREQAEWDQGHIPGARFMPLSQFEEAHMSLTDLNAEIVLQCRSGQRSLRACMFLQSQGFTNLTNLEGGIIGWDEQG